MTTTNNSDIDFLQQNHLPRPSQQIAVRWKLKERDGYQFFLAKVKGIDEAQKSFQVEYTGFSEASGERHGTIHMDTDNNNNSLPWHVVDARRSTATERMKEIRKGDHLLLHHIQEDDAPVLYEVVVEKVDRRNKTFSFFFEVFQELEEYTFRAMKNEVWHRIPSLNWL